MTIITLTIGLPGSILANSLKYPQRIEWSQSLNRLIVLCKQIFSFFPLSSFSFYTVQYRGVQYSTVIGQLPQVSTEDRVVSVFETSVCSLFFVLCQQIGQLPRVSTEDRVVSVFEFRVTFNIIIGLLPRRSTED